MVTARVSASAVVSLASLGRVPSARALPRAVTGSGAVSVFSSRRCGALFSSLSNNDGHSGPSDRTPRGGHTGYTSVGVDVGVGVGVGVGSAVAVGPSARRSAVLEVVKRQVEQHSDAFYVVDLAQVARKHAEWVTELPRVRPFFAVKCNDDPRIVETLAALGTGFDCASKGEMSMALGLGVAPADIIFAHPAKQPSHIQYARGKGVTRMTFDNVDELRKIAVEHPEAEVVLRILTDDSHSVCRLGLKFGCPLEDVKPVLTVAKELGVNVVGISYHVGSGNGNAASFGDAVRDARTAFNAAAEVGYTLRLLDIGGGFPGSEMGAEAGADTLRGATADVNNPYSKHPSFKTIASFVRTALDTHFPEGCGVTLIAEPGRFFVKSSHVLAVNVVGKRKTVDEATGGTRINYYVNDGLYGSFNCVMYDHVTCAPSLVLAADTAKATIALAASRAATADDSIVRLDADGSTVVSDAIGLGHAAQLRSAVDVDAHATEEEAPTQRMQLGGSGQRYVDEEDVVVAHTATFSASAGTDFRAGSAMLAAASVVAGGNGSSSSRGVAKRAFSYTPASSASSSSSSGAEFPTTIWGPTCDSIDKVTDAITMPEIALGDWLVFENMGAYTIAGSCKFNGFPLATKVYIGLDGRLDVQREEVTA